MKKYFGKINGKRSFYQWIFLFVVIILFCYYISNHWYQLLLIQGNSMSPTYHSGQVVVLDRYHREFTYGDVIAFWCERLNTVLVKRVAACSEDEVVIKEGILYINGEISLWYTDKVQFGYAGSLKETVKLEKDQYFVIGDNIEESKDSRYDIVGYVSEADILGKVISVRFIE